MKDPFENYECDGQITLDEYYNSTFPKTCCGVTPWLAKTKCCHWDNSKPQTYMMYYICPKCMKTAVDDTGWIKYRNGTYEEASQKALADWNNPDATFEVKDFNANSYVHVSFDEYELWEKLYGQSYEEYSTPIIERLNEEFRKRREGNVYDKQRDTEQKE